MRKSLPFRRGSLVGILLAPALIAVAWSAVGAEREPAPLRILSSRLDTVSGNEVLVQLDPAIQRDSPWTVRLNGGDVSASFKRADSGELRALLTGLKLGKNSLEVKRGRARSRIELINHPLTGPVFSGPHQQPFICETVLNGLGAPLDANCRAPTRVEYYYKPNPPVPVDRRESLAAALYVFSGKNTLGFPAGFKAYDPEHPAKDVAQTTLLDGRSVPYIVRRELGVINRAVYDIRFLHQPDKPLPTPWTRSGSAWNGRLVYALSGGGLGGYRQGYLIGPASDEAVLALGYAVATSTLNIFGNNSNDVLSAETLSMVKEYFIKTYGVPVHTIGWGDSGGALLQYQIAQNYPGLLDGIIPYLSFPDYLSTITQGDDCALLNHGFQLSKHTWTEGQKTAVAGLAAWKTCGGAGGNSDILPDSCVSVVPTDQVYDPVDRPRGVRCDIFDNEVNVYGRDPKTGFAVRPIDNIGVQYGLSAFNAGQIDADRFLELNELVGGYDADGNLIPQRNEADPETIRRMYRHGLMLTGGGGLSAIPIIDWRWYADDQGDYHDSFHSFITRGRLIAANGSAANQVMLFYARANTAINTFLRLSDPNPQSSFVTGRERELVGLMDRWLDNLAADSTQGTPLEKIMRAKPQELTEGCWETDGDKLVEPLSYRGPGRCQQLYPSYGDPRTAAGGPLADDILKCALKPVDPTDYTHPLSPAQLARLKALFSSGVCDYTRPGVGQEVTRATWQSY